MHSVVGIFEARDEAEDARERLIDLGIKPDNITFLTPGARQTELDAVPTTDTEQPGIGTALGGVVGGTVGLSTAAAASAILVPGIGPVLGTGILATSLLGLMGALGGAAIGGHLEHAFANGLPKDEIFLYEDALRQGRTVVIALADDGVQAEAARLAFASAGAEGVDTAREEWWLGLRDAEEAQYEAENDDSFHADEEDFRRGFEAALRPETRGRSYDEVAEQLRARAGATVREQPFRRGFERGRAYYQQRAKCEER